MGFSFSANSGIIIPFLQLPLISLVKFYFYRSIMAMESSLGDMLLKVVVFIVVQALVYLILSKSSNVFSKSQLIKSPSFKTARSVSIYYRMLASLSDMPAGGDLPSPSNSVKYSSPTTQEEDNSAALLHDYTS